MPKKRDVADEGTAHASRYKESPSITVHFRLEDPTPTHHSKAKAMLEKAGMKPLRQTQDGWIVSATREQIEKATSVKVKEKKVNVGLQHTKVQAIRRSFQGLPSKEPPPLDSSGLGRFIFSVPPSHNVPSAYPPRPPYYHLHPCRDLPVLFGVEGMHSRGILGQRIRVAMVDSGFYPHPYYQDPGIHEGTLPAITTHAVASDPNVDDEGHGTLITANLFGIAPGCDFHHVKYDDSTHAGLVLARSLNPHIITCSWGYPDPQVADVLTNYPSSGEALFYGSVRSEIQAALAAGITVLFSSGNLVTPPNGPHWPSGEPGVISVGGAFIDKKFRLSASSFASSFTSQVTGKSCPDVCGLVGPAPVGLLFPLPTQPGSTFDTGYGPLDQTTTNDGWCVTSGTSGATPQLAGMAALLMQLYGGQTPQEVLAHFQEMAVGVHTGKTATGDRATKARPNRATGWGFVSFRRPHSKHNYFFF